MKTFKLTNYPVKSQEKQTFKINGTSKVPFEKLEPTLKEINRVQQSIQEISVVDLRKLRKTFSF